MPVWADFGLCDNIWVRACCRPQAAPGASKAQRCRPNSRRQAPQARCGPHGDRRISQRRAFEKRSACRHFDCEWLGSRFQRVRVLGLGGFGRGDHQIGKTAFFDARKGWPALGGVLQAVLFRSRGHTSGFRIALQALEGSKTSRQLSSEHPIHADLIRAARRLTPARRSDQTAAAGRRRQGRDACGWHGACPRRRYCGTFGRGRPGWRRRCWPGYGRGARWRG